MRHTSFNHYLILLLVGFALLHSACSSVSPRYLKDLDGPGVEFQDKKVYKFRDQGVYFSNRFDGARLNRVSSLSDSTFVISITAENTPINPSPWFAFQVWSQAPRNIHIVLDYGNSKHRYWPKVRQADGTFHPVQKLELNESQSAAGFSLPVGSEKKLISGQPFFNKDSILNWLHQLDKKPYVKLEKIGKSTLGEKMLGFHTPATLHKKAIAIMGGQHPPEITGFRAQMAFVGFLLGDDPLAVRFREQYQIVAVPWINPDGNNQGHWRHNVAGVDLNRDWATFKQKETTAARDYFLRFAQDSGVDFVFGIDFHSTYWDVLYTNKPGDDYVTHRPGLMNEWAARWNHTLSDLAVKVEPSDPNGRVSKSWLLTGLGAEAVTYEVADTTPLEEIHYKATQAAIALVLVLLEEKP